MFHISSSVIYRFEKKIHIRLMIGQKLHHFIFMKITTPRIIDEQRKWTNYN